MLDKIIDIVDITNTGNQPIQVGVGPVDENFLIGTDVTPFDGSFFFDGSGQVKIFPGRNFIIEEYRVNLGQLQNYIDGGQARVLYQKRLLSALQEETN